MDGLSFICERRAQKSQTEKTPAFKEFIAVLGETPLAHQSLMSFVSSGCTRLCTERGHALPSGRGHGTPGATARRHPPLCTRAQTRRLRGCARCGAPRPTGDSVRAVSALPSLTSLTAPTPFHLQRPAVFADLLSQTDRAPRGQA